MFVYVVLARRGESAPYIVAVFTDARAAGAYRERWQQQHPGASAHIERYTVVDGCNGR